MSLTVRGIKLGALILGFIASSALSCAPNDAIKDMSYRIVQLIATPQQAKSVTEYIPLGTGFIIDNEGYVVTAGHLIDIGEKIIAGEYKSTGKMAIVIFPAPVVVGNPLTGELGINDFEIVKRDYSHDLALLKINIDRAISPRDGQELHLARFSNNVYGTLFFSKISIIQNLQPGTNAAVIGYPSKFEKPETKLGTVNSKEINDVLNLQSTVANETVKYTARDYFSTDIASSQNLSGSPVYSPSNGKIFGVYLTGIDENTNEVKTILISGKYLKAILDS